MRVSYLLCCGRWRAALPPQFRVFLTKAKFLAPGEHSDCFRSLGRKPCYPGLLLSARFLLRDLSSLARYRAHPLERHWRLRDGRARNRASGRELTEEEARSQGAQYRARGPVKGLRSHQKEALHSSLTRKTADARKDAKARFVPTAYQAPGPGG